MLEANDSMWATLLTSPISTQCPICGVSHVPELPCIILIFLSWVFILMTFTYCYKPARINSLDPAASPLTRWLLPFVISNIPKENDYSLTKWNRASANTISVASQSKEWLIANNVLENLREAPEKKDRGPFTSSTFCFLDCFGCDFVPPATNICIQLTICVFSCWVSEHSYRIHPRERIYWVLASMYADSRHGLCLASLISQI